MIRAMLLQGCASEIVAGTQYLRSYRPVSVLFFKCIKEHLRIKALLGTSEKALKTQIWIAVCTYIEAALIRDFGTHYFGYEAYPNIDYWLEWASCV